MARIKLGDKVVINANKYRKEMGGDIGGFPISGLLNPKIASTTIQSIIKDTNNILIIKFYWTKITISNMTFIRRLTGFSQTINLIV